MARFEERVFGLLRSFVDIGRQDPALLVAVLRVVEMQETVDRQIGASAEGEGFHKCRMSSKSRGPAALRIVEMQA